MSSFRVAQKVAIFDDRDEVLIVRFADSERTALSLRKMWDFPGGGLRWGESLLNGLWREIEEELGKVELELYNPLLVWDWIQAEDPNERSVCTLFRAKYLSGKIKLNEEHDEYKWVYPADLLKHEWMEPDKKAVVHLQQILGIGGAHKEWVKYPMGLNSKGAWCDGCKRYNVRNSTADMIAVRDGKILMIQRGQDPQAGFWALPAGYVGWDETLEEGAARELKEEVGLTADSIELLGVYSDPKRDLDGRQNMAHVFVAKVSGEMEKNVEEVKKVQWFELDMLPERIAFDHRQMIADYKKKQ